jgi:hypothetical protein
LSIFAKQMIAKPVKKEIGWKDKIDFIDFNLFNIDAKIDTGAKTSVIHCSYIEKMAGKKKMVKFIPLSSKLDIDSDNSFILPYHEERKIKNSFGSQENRFIIKTHILIMNRKILIDISLRDRSAMEFPVLIGRDTIRNQFIVNVARTNVSYKKKLKKTK